MMDEKREALVELKHIHKEFPGVKVLEDISIAFYPGEVHVLLGENGAGKSTIIKIISGIYQRKIFVKPSIAVSASFTRN